MTPLTERITKSGNMDRVLSARQLGRLIGGGDARRYGLVNRALKSGELLKVRRGLYVLAREYRRTAIHPFVVAQHMLPGSYISAETALSFHGWIPEVVHTVLSMTNGGKSLNYAPDGLGMFEFRRMTTHPGYFLQFVNRYELNGQAALVAEPMRALMDLMYLRKQAWDGWGFLIDGMRVDNEAISAVPLSQVSGLLDVYKGERERAFIEELLKYL